MTRSHNASLLLYQSNLLLPYSKRLIHGFTGKPMSLGGPDTPANPRGQVLENRRELAASINTEADSWLIPNQVHGHRIGRTGDKDFAQTDGILLTVPDSPVMLLFADCVPVLLYDPKHHAGAVVHAGWRGTSQGIVAETVLTMQNTLGSQPEDLLAVIGPAIHVCCFQVSVPVAEAVGQSIQHTLIQMADTGFLFWDEAYPENPRLDLKAVNKYQLTQAGITQIEILPACTRCLENQLYSYRRGEDGRNGAFMMLGRVDIRVHEDADARHEERSDRSLDKTK